MELHWGDGGGEAGSGGGSYGSGGDGYGGDAAAAESRPGVVLYSFAAENEDEVSAEEEEGGLGGWVGVAGCTA